MKKIVLAAGCFWGTQEYYRRVNGVVQTRVGYAQGVIEEPTYQQVKAQISGHTEVCEVGYDESIVSLEKLLEHLFYIIDPTSLNKQGADEGTSYRTGIYPDNEADLEIAQKFVRSQQANYEKPIVVEVEMLKTFWDAEDFHQDYLLKNPTGYCHINLNKLKQL